MISFSMRALLPVSFLIALGSGCAHRNKPDAAASPSPTTSAPSSTVTRFRPSGDVTWARYWAAAARAPSAQVTVSVRRRAEHRIHVGISFTG